MALVLFVVPLESVLLPAWFSAAGDVGGLTSVLAGFAVGAFSGPCPSPDWLPDGAADRCC